MTDVDIRQKDVEATRENHNPETNRNLELKTLNGPTRQSRDDNLLTTREITPDRRDPDFALKSNKKKKVHSISTIIIQLEHFQEPTNGALGNYTYVYGAQTYVLVFSEFKSSLILIKVLHS